MANNLTVPHAHTAQRKVAKLKAIGEFLGVGPESMGLSVRPLRKNGVRGLAAIDISCNVFPVSMLYIIVGRLLQVKQPLSTPLTAWA